MLAANSNNKNNNGKINNNNSSTISLVKPYNILSFALHVVVAAPMHSHMETHTHLHILFSFSPLCTRLHYFRNFTNAHIRSHFQFYSINFFVAVFVVAVVFLFRRDLQFDQIFITFHRLPPKQFPAFKGNFSTLTNHSFRPVGSVVNSLKTHCLYVFVSV